MVEARGANSPLRKIGVPDNLPNSKYCQIGDEHHSSNEIEVIPDHFGRSTLPLIFRRIHPHFLGSLQSIANKTSTEFDHPDFRNQPNDSQFPLTYL